jgi:hypothetical protein
MASDGTFNLLAILDGRFTNPSATLIQGADRNYYGTSPGKGGDITPGSVFAVTSAGNLKLLHLFNRNQGGANPIAGLVIGNDGGILRDDCRRRSVFLCHDFRMSPAGFLSTIHSFNWDDGCNPLGALLLANDGNFYGTTYAGARGTTALFFR